MSVLKKIRAGGDALLRMDRRCQEVFEEVPDGPIGPALHLFSKLGDQPQLRILSGGLMLAGIFRGDDRLTRAGARMMIAHEAATFAKDRVKTNIDRKRPRSADKPHESKPKAGQHTSKEMTSFPSGHTAGAVAAARAFAREYPEHATLALGAGLLVAGSQIPRCAHYPTDVAAGAVVGLVAESAVDAIWRTADMDERSES